MKKSIPRKEAKEKVRCFIEAISLQSEYQKMLEKSVPVESVTYEFGEKMEKVKVIAVIDGEKREFDFVEVIGKSEGKGD